MPDRVVRVAIDRLIEIFGLLAQREGSDVGPTSLCAVAAEVTGRSAASIGLFSSDQNLTTFCASGPLADSLMDLEITLGEGPCLDACRSEDVIDESDLAFSTNSAWSAYTPEAVAVGAGAVFGFPVRIGAIRLGALGLYHHEPGPLSDEQQNDAHLMASVIGRAILALQTGVSRGNLAGELEREATFDFSVHQAAGMVAVQGAMTVGDALVALRTHAFSTSVALSTVASRVVRRELRFDLTTRSWSDESDRLGETAV